MPRRPVSAARRWRYLDETSRVLADVRHPDGSTLLAVPGGVYELHPDTPADFTHPLLEPTDDPASDPASDPDITVMDGAAAADTADPTDTTPAGEQDHEEP